MRWCSVVGRRRFGDCVFERACVVLSAPASVLEGCGVVVWGIRCRYLYARKEGRLDTEGERREKDKRYRDQKERERTTHDVVPREPRSLPPPRFCPRGCCLAGAWRVCASAAILQHYCTPAIPSDPIRLICLVLLCYCVVQISPSRVHG